MSISISNISNSFIQSTESCEYVLPVMSESDIKFQLHLLAGDFAETSDLMDGDIELFVIEKGASVIDDTTLSAAVIGSGEAVVAGIIWRIGDTKIAAYWSGCFSDFESIALGTCFQFLLRVTIGETKSYFPLSCFKKVIEDYLSTIQYSCIENSYGFAYCDKYVPNKIRLPFFLSKPNRKSERSVYFKSDGSAKVTKSVLRKEYDGFVGHLPDELHEKLNVALEHESVFIESSRYTGDARLSEDYEVKWTEINMYHMAPATFKVNATPFSASINNCADCDGWEEPSCSSAIQIIQSGIEAETIYAQWQVVSGTPVKFIVKINGGEPVEITELIYSQDESEPGEYTISVTPVCVAGSTAVEGEEKIATIIIPDPEEECTSVSFGEISLPDGNVDQLYSVIIPFTGTLPAAVINATKPTWLNVSLSGNNLILSGTPLSGDAANNITISVQLSNCEGDTATITDTMNIVGTVAYPLNNIKISPYEDDGICTAIPTTVYLASGNYNFAPGVKVYVSPTLTTWYSLRYMLDTNNDLWRTNIFGELQLIQVNYC